MEVLINGDLAPIVLFTYNRPRHTKATLDALKANHLAKQSVLYIYQDGLKENATKEQRESVLEVGSYLQDFITSNENGKYFKEITLIQRERNFGLADSIIDGVTNIINKYGTIIVLEDDLVTSPYFLTFMNEALQVYRNNEHVACISGFVFPLEGEEFPSSFFLKGTDCWGWASWDRAWKLFNPDGKELLDKLRQSGKIDDFDKAYSGAKSSRGFAQMLEDQIRGKNSSWAIRWFASCFLQDKYCLYPRNSLVQNIGFDIGTHCKGGKENDPYFGVLSNIPTIIDTEQPIQEIPAIRAKCNMYYTNKQFQLLKIILGKIYKMLIRGGQDSGSHLSLEYSKAYRFYVSHTIPYNLHNSQTLVFQVKPLESYSLDDLAAIVNDIESFIKPAAFFSVVIPAHNRAHSILACVDSVCRQTFVDYEIIIIDDASTDNTESLIHSLDNPKIRYYRLQNNMGAQIARNIGIKMAKGKWIAFLDSDDLWESNKLSIQHDMIKRHADKQEPFLYGACVVSNETTGIKDYWDLSPQDPHFLKSPAPMFQSMVVSKVSLLKIGLLDENVPSYQEWDTAIRLAQICEIFYSRQTLFTYRLHGKDQISKNHKKDVDGYHYILQKHKKAIVSANPLWWNMHIFILLKRCYMFGEYCFASRVVQELKLFYQKPILYLFLLKMAKYSVKSRLCNIATHFFLRLNDKILKVVDAYR